MGELVQHQPDNDIRLGFTETAFIMNRKKNEIVFRNSFT